MDRREAIRLLATAAGLSLVPPQLRALLREARAEVGDLPALRTLDAHQNEIVTTMAEMIIPATETPGAKAARVNEFIDLILTEWCNDEERTRFLHGLTDADARSGKLFGKDFVGCAPDQQKEILTALDEEMMREAEALKYAARDSRGSPPHPEKNFFYIMKHLTLTGYYTSQIGAEQELHFQMFPGHFDGCVPVTEATGAGE